MTLTGWQFHNARLRRGLELRDLATQSGMDRHRLTHAETMLHVDPNRAITSCVFGPILTGKYCSNEEHLTMSDEVHQGDRDLKRNRTPEIEIAIGARIRALRVMMGLSQTTLGEAIGVTFQQVQKYENGKDRIAASTLQVLAGLLGVHPGSFFDVEIPAPAGNISDVRSSLKGMARFQRISDPRLRSSLTALISVLADPTEPEPPQHGSISSLALDAAGANPMTGTEGAPGVRQRKPKQKDEAP